MCFSNWVYNFNVVSVDVGRVRCCRDVGLRFGDSMIVITSQRTFRA